MKLTLKGGRLVDENGQERGTVKLVIDVDLEAPELADGQLAIEVPAQQQPGEVEEVWAHYCELMKPRNRALDQETRALIRAALKVASVDECKGAITGCYQSDFHMKRGEYANRSAGRYNKPSQILKGKRGIRTTREQIDLFLDIARKSGGEVGVLSGDPVRIRDAKQDVLAAHEFPDDEHTAQRGSEARRWLENQGWTIGARPHDGWPTFTAPASSVP